MYNHYLYFAYWAVNSFIFFLAGLLIPSSEVAMGSWRFSLIEASIYSGFCLTFIIWVCWDFAMARHYNFKKKGFTLGFFIAANLFSLYAISTFSYVTGFRVESFLWFILLGIVFALIQRVAWRVVVGNSIYI
jgi:hypothetical protein